MSTTITMKTLQHHLRLVVMACIGLLFQQCSPELDCGNSDKVTDYKIGSDDLNKIPYTGFETLSFVRTTQGDTHTFVGNGWKQDWGLTTTQDDCPQKERYERRQLTFTSSTFPKPITISMYRQSINKWTYLNIGFQNTLFDLSGVNGLGRKINIVTVHSREYANVDSFSSNNISPFPTNYMCYYNLTDGVIKMRLTSGENWELIKP